MSVSFQVFSDMNLIHLRFEDQLTVDDTRAALARLQEHPDFHPWLNRVLDLRGVTSWERDYSRFMALEAENSARFTDQATPPILLCIADSPLSREIANFLRRSWENLEGLIFRMTSSEAEALSILGLQANKISGLTATP